MERQSVFMDRKIYVVKMPVLPNTIYRFNTIPNQNPSGLFCRNSQANPKIHMECKGLWGTKTVLKSKEQQIWRTHTFQFQSLLQWSLRSSRRCATGLRTDIDRWTGTEGLEIILHIYVQLIFHKGTKSIQWGRNWLLNTGYWDNWLSICKRPLHITP